MPLTRPNTDGVSRRGRDLNPRGSYKPPTRLAGERLRPLGHLSFGPASDEKTLPTLAEGVGFEPTRELQTPNGISSAAH